MTINQAKDIEQKICLNAWLKAKFIGTAEAATAFGKCRVGILASARFAKKNNYKYKILIITPTTAIQEEWKKEFIKWGEKKVLLNCVEIQCINTARKFKNRYYDLVIGDEIHNFLKGEINSKFFKNNKYNKILGLSGTIEDNLLFELNKIAPICYSLDLYKAVELGLVSDFTVYNIPVKLTIAERKEYEKLTSSIGYAWQAYNIHSWKNISARKNIVYNAKAKMKTLKTLTNCFNKNSHGIIFSMTKNQADIVKNKLKDTCVLHHSGITKKNRLLNLNKFADGRTKIKMLSSAKTLDEGVTLPRLEYAIIMANSSKAKQQRQRVGRCIRLGKNGKHAIIIRLYCENTIEEKWLESSQAKLKVINIKNVQELKKLINK